MTNRNRNNPRRRPVNTSLPEAGKPAASPAPSVAAQPQPQPQPPPRKPAPKPAADKPAAASPAPAKPAAARPANSARHKPAMPAATSVTPVMQDAAASSGDKEKSGKKKKEAGKKAKQVRDSFTLPEADYALFAQLKARCLAKGIEVKKSELLRAALRQLAGLDDVLLAAVLAEVEKIKTGRPSK